MNNIIIIGGDKRQSELNRILSDEGMSCIYFNSSDDDLSSIELHRDDIVILPVPVSKDKETVYSSVKGFNVKLNDIISRLSCTNTVFAGGFSNAVKAYLKEKNVNYFDYLDSEELTVYNAYLTGLGAVRLLFRGTDEDVTDKKVLITGFGRVAEFTAGALRNAGCDVYITARKKLQLIRAECSGYRVIDFEKRSAFLYLFDYIFNSVPCNIFSEEDISRYKGKYFELASFPYGVNKEWFCHRKSDYYDGGSLPGRYLSRSAAEKLAEITLEHIKFRNGGD